MTRYLMQISIGPVQDFIASARRARDLWFGSFMLSEISKAVARAIKESGGKLIFPYSKKLDSDLECGSDFNVANVILAEFDNEKIVKNASSDAKTGAENQWLSFVEKAYSGLEKGIYKDLWDYQVNKGVIEFYSAWYPFDNSDEASYKTARQKVKRLIDARKNLRDFEQWDGKPFVPKSSLDGLRESVLKDNKKPVIYGSFSKKEGESLDLIGCVKRFSGGRVHFPSVVRIAVDPWLRILAKNTKGKNLIKEIENICNELADKNVISRVGNKVYELFPYEGSILLPSRHKEIIEEAVKTGKYDSTEIKEILKNIEIKISVMKEIYPFKDPYLAILIADGDKMGKAISELNTRAQHREFSEQLSTFAQYARKIVEECNGTCIYTGGDDVCALLPIDKALKCARNLYDSFASIWENGFYNISEKPTLSVGIAVMHTLEDLEMMREYAKKAENHAKEGERDDKSNKRNALAITMKTRGNEEIPIREQWSDTNASKPIDERLQFWAERYARKEIPTRFAYELIEIASLYENWSNENTVSEAMKIDVLNVFRRKDIKLTKEDKDNVEKYIKSQIKGSYKSIIRLSNELIIAQWLGGYQA